MAIPFIPSNSSQSIPNVQVNGTGIPLIRGSGINTIGIRGVNVADIRSNRIPETRTWLINPPRAIPPTVPVTVFAGTPIVNMPGCVTVHKENAKRPPSRNKNLVNDDPKGQTTLCDAGMPYYQPPDYDYRELSWRTVYMNEDEEAEGVKTEPDAPPTPETPEPPITPASTAKVVECPPNNAQRVGDLSQSGKEKVKGYELNETKTECITLWEPVPWTQQYLPDPGIVTTTATIAAVAATSALLAKPLADLLLKVVKPTVKKVVGKVNAILGKTPYQMTESEKKTNEYRLKKGLLPIPFAKNHAKKMKDQKKNPQS